MGKINPAISQNSDSGKCKIGERVILIGYGSAQSAFVVPSDGYIILQSNNKVDEQSIMYSADRNEVLLVARSNGYYYGNETLYVKKGMRVYFQISATGGGASFFPLI